MNAKSKLLKTTILAVLVSLAGVAAISPASAHDMDRSAGYSRVDGDRDGGGSRHERFEHFRHHRHFHRGWYR